MEDKNSHSNDTFKILIRIFGQKGTFARTSYEESRGVDFVIIVFLIGMMAVL